MVPPTCSIASSKLLRQLSTVSAETVDNCLKSLEEAILQVGGTMLITADHGNLERMSDQNDNPHTAHTLSPVPLILVNSPKFVDGPIYELW